MAIEIRNMSDIPWTDSGKSGVLSQNLRYDTSAGRYFGAARFEPYSRSGVHRHLGPAVSYMLEGSLSDHDNDVREGQAYINLTGAVHDVSASNAIWRRRQGVKPAPRFKWHSQAAAIKASLMLGAVWRAPGQGPKGLAREPGAAAKAPSGPDLSATTFKSRSRFAPTP